MRELLDLRRNTIGTMETYLLNTYLRMIDAKFISVAYVGKCLVVANNPQYPVWYSCKN